MRRLAYTDDAEQDLADISLRIAVGSQDRAIAEAFADRLRKHCANIASLPGTLGTARPELLNDLRSTPHQGYIIFFRYVGDTLEIVNILDGHRDIAGYFGGNDNEPSS